jgi:hypothetical protein
MGLPSKLRIFRNASDVALIYMRIPVPIEWVDHILVLHMLGVFTVCMKRAQLDLSIAGVAISLLAQFG